MRDSKQVRKLGVFVLVAGFAAATLGQTPIIYPAKNQTAEQQKKDEGECAVWAKDNTGIDPVALAAAPATPAPAPAAEAAQPEKTGPSGARLRGAARGAAAGAIIGEVADDDAGDGAAVGAVAGAMSGGAADRRGRRQQKQQAEQQAAAQQQQAQQQADAKKQEQLATYQRANSACLEGRGYTVK